MNIFDSMYTLIFIYKFEIFNLKFKLYYLRHNIILKYNDNHSISMQMRIISIYLGEYININYTYCLHIYYIQATSAH